MYQRHDGPNTPQVRAGRVIRAQSWFAGLCMRDAMSVDGDRVKVERREDHREAKVEQQRVKSPE
jgi:hypothetical protein